MVDFADVVYLDAGINGSIMTGKYGTTGGTLTSFGATTPATATRHVEDSIDTDDRSRGMHVSYGYEIDSDAGDLSFVTDYTIANLSTHVSIDADQTALTVLRATITGLNTDAFS